MPHKGDPGLQQVAQLEVGGLEGDQVVGAGQRVQVTWGGGGGRGGSRRMYGAKQKLVRQRMSVCKGCVVVKQG
jgi:hypothetical protein